MIVKRTLQIIAAALIAHNFLLSPALAGQLEECELAKLDWHKIEICGTAITQIRNKLASQDHADQFDFVLTSYLSRAYQHQANAYYALAMRQLSFKEGHKKYGSDYSALLTANIVSLELKIDCIHQILRHERRNAAIRVYEQDKALTLERLAGSKFQLAGAALSSDTKTEILYSALGAIEDAIRLAPDAQSSPNLRTFILDEIRKTETLGTIPNHQKPKVGQVDSVY